MELRELPEVPFWRVPHKSPILGGIAAVKSCHIHDKVGGVLMLAGTLGADYLAVLELIHPLTGIDAVPIYGCQRIRQLVLTAKTVAAVLRLPVDRIACNADGICLLLDKRSVVSSHSKERGYGLCRLHGTAETALCTASF